MVAAERALHPSCTSDKGSYYVAEHRKIQKTSLLTRFGHLLSASRLRGASPVNGSKNRYFFSSLFDCMCI